MRPSFASPQRHEKIRPRPTHDPQKWCPVFGQDHAQRRGRRSAERRMPTATSTNVAARRCLGAAARQIGARPPSGATPRLSQGLPSLLSSRPCFLGRGQRTIRRSRGENRRALPALSCPSPVTAPHASAVIPKGMMPKAAPERVASPRGGTALAPLPKVPSRRRPSMSEIFVL
jgi:hypothetical protein